MDTLRGIETFTLNHTRRKFFDRIYRIDGICFAFNPVNPVNPVKEWVCLCVFVVLKKSKPEL
jgi:hypothetical protein